MPEWVQVWSWLRFMRTPTLMTPLPQQDVPSEDAMTMGRYEQLRSEWVRAGRPSMTIGALVAVMSGDVDIPF